MKQIARIIAVIALAGIIVWLLATPLYKVLNKYNYHDRRRLTEIYLDSTAHDMLFIGSSRTYRDIYPKIIDSICGVNSFNGGMDAGTIYDFKFTLDGYLVHHPVPRVLVLTLDLISFAGSPGVHAYPQYYPYLDNKVVYATMSDYGYHVWMVRRFPFMMITDYDDFSKENALNLLRGRDTQDLAKGEFEYKGYLTNGDNYIKKPSLEKVKSRISMTPQGIKALDDMIAECQKRHIKVIFTYAPEYNFYLQKSRTNVDSVVSMIRETANKNNIPYLRDDSLPLCQDPHLFANNGHLNTKGSFIYSAVLARELNTILSRDTVK